MDLKFYPEGGALVAGLPGHVAFELNDENGQHVATEVTIYNRHKQIIARTHTVHRGRGTFVIPKSQPKKNTKPYSDTGNMNMKWNYLRWKMRDVRFTLRKTTA